MADKIRVMQIGYAMAWLGRVRSFVKSGDTVNALMCLNFAEDNFTSALDIRASEEAIEEIVKANGGES